ncbi:hypothetical protein AVEN_182801-1 [Araneus ventricosus]|uniref:Uncharacterized protein n=1 Tax=Araneus ventricosus TaxID=182803 RepID=A0A4Y2HRK4_ARAVE|nr:hypothetical protein AVEN_182801-1 [Araneus ventricosus]
MYHWPRFFIVTAAGDPPYHLLAEPQNCPTQQGLNCRDTPEDNISILPVKMLSPSISAPEELIGGESLPTSASFILCTSLQPPFMYLGRKSIILLLLREETRS